MAKWVGYRLMKRKRREQLVNSIWPKSIIDVHQSPGRVDFLDMKYWGKAAYPYPDEEFPGYGSTTHRELLQKIRRQLDEFNRGPV
jgi:hypothetical protein